MDDLNNLDLLKNINSSTQQLNKWIEELSSQEFYSNFLKANGIDIIVEKVVLSLGNIDLSQQQNYTLQLQIIQLFDKLLSGTNQYHQWLFKKLCQLSSELQKLSSNSNNSNNSNLNNNNNNNSNLVDVITKEAKALIHAQTKNPVINKNEIGMLLYI